MQYKTLQCNIVLGSPPLYLHLHLPTNYLHCELPRGGEILIVSGQCNQLALYYNTSPAPLLLPMIVILLSLILAPEASLVNICNMIYICSLHSPLCTYCIHYIMVQYYVNFVTKTNIKIPKCSIVVSIVSICLADQLLRYNLHLSSRCSCTYCLNYKMSKTKTKTKLQYCCVDCQCLLISHSTLIASPLINCSASTSLVGATRWSWHQ